MTQNIRHVNASCSCTVNEKCIHTLLHKERLTKQCTHFLHIYNVHILLIHNKIFCQRYEKKTVYISYVTTVVRGFAFTRVYIVCNTE